ncbi:MAG: fibronectin type III domain-containing protein [Nanoarchaeota archaeon]
MNFKIEIIFIFTFLFLIPYAFAGTISSCNPALVSGTPGNPNVYTITTNIQSSGNCVTINGLNNVVIDGNGFTITSTGGNAFTIGGHSTAITIKNANIDAVNSVYFIGGGASQSCSTNDADGVLIVGNTILRGDISKTSSSTLCNIALVNNKINAGVSLENYGSEGGPVVSLVNFTIINNNISDGLSIRYINRALIKDNKIYKYGNPGLWSVLFDFFKVNNTIISNNTFITNANYAYTEPSTGQDGLAEYKHVYNTVMENNFFNFTNYGSLGRKIDIIIYAQNNTFRNNIFIHDQFENSLHQAILKFRSNSYGASKENYVFNNTIISGRPVGSGIMVFFGNGEVLNDNVFDSNIIYTKSNAYGGAMTCATCGPGTIIKNNIIIGVDSAPLSFGDCKATIKAYNNVLVGENAGAIVENQDCTHEARNNIMYYSSGYNAMPAAVVGDYNLFYPAYSSGQAHSISGQDPQFINPTANPIFDSNYNLLRNYRLQSTSLAKDAGDPTTQVPIDKDGNVRPNGLRQDIGAYEYGLGPVLPICSDTDSGINYNVQGTVAITGNPITYTDYCNANGITLNEYYCLTPQATSPSISSYSCQYGCINGKCNPDTTAPVISNIQSSSITGNSAVITWTTDESSTSLVKYGTTQGSYPSQATGASGTSHSVSLSGLNANTQYYYVVRSTDANNNVAQSSQNTFTTISTVSCGAVCNGCVNNRILATSCTTPIRQCDGTNSVEDVSISPGSIIAGQQVTATISYSCYGSTDNLALWYYDMITWKLLKYWAPGTLTGCDVIPDGSDGTVSFTFTPNTNPGTHYIRAIEADGTVYSNTNSCPNIQWGNIDDLAFNVQMPSDAGTPEPGPILIRPRRRAPEFFNYIGLLIVVVSFLMFIAMLLSKRKPKKIALKKAKKKS